MGCCVRCMQHGVQSGHATSVYQYTRRILTWMGAWGGTGSMWCCVRCMQHGVQSGHATSWISVSGRHTFRFWEKHDTFWMFAMHTPNANRQGWLLPLLRQSKVASKTEELCRNAETAERGCETNVIRF